MSRASVLAVVSLGAAAAALPAHAQDPSADRYGPSAAAPRAAAYPGAAPVPGSYPTSFRGRVLSWPGKSASAPAAPAYAPLAAQAYARPTYAPQAYGPAPEARAHVRRSYPGIAASQPYQSTGYARPAPGRQAYAPPRPQAYTRPTYAAAPVPSAPAGSQVQDGWRPVFAPAPPARSPMQEAGDGAPALAGAPVSAPAPTSLYTPAATPTMSPAARAAAAPPPLRTASAAQRYGYDPRQGHAVRFYSVHRPFGLTPDPAPIPPQFFTASADLAEPAGPLPTERSTTTSSSGTRIVHAAPDTSTN